MSWLKPRPTKILMFLHRLSNGSFHQETGASLRCRGMAVHETASQRIGRRARHPAPLQLIYPGNIVITIELASVLGRVCENYGLIAL